MSAVSLSTIFFSATVLNLFISQYAFNATWNHLLVITRNILLHICRKYIFNSISLHM